MVRVRLPYLALAFALGAASLWAASAFIPWGHDALLSLLWTVLAALAWLALVVGLPPRARVLLLFALAGAGRMAGERLAVERPPTLPADARAGDRQAETLRGVIVGPITARHRYRAFVLALEGGVRVWVSAPAAEPALLPGDRVRVRGRLRVARGYRVPGARDLRRDMSARGAHYALSAHDATQIAVLGARGTPWRVAAEAQRWAVATIARGRSGRDADADADADAARHATERAAAVAAAQAMLTGWRAGLTPAASERFRAAGVAHVLAVSGLHLAVLAWTVFALVRRLWSALPALAGRLEATRVAALLAALSGVAFTGLTGAQVATTRALLVVLVILCGMAVYRRARVIDALGASALLLLLEQPLLVFDPAFQLSFAATATLALALGRRSDSDPADEPGPEVEIRRNRHLSRLWRWLGGLWSASAWAAAATAPIAALAFGAVATGGLLANLVAVPLVELAVVPVGMLGLLLAAVNQPLGQLVLDLAVGASGWVVRVAELAAAHAPVVHTPPPSALELLACAALWAGAIAWRRRRWPRRTAIAVLAAGALLLALALALAAWGPLARSGLRVTFLDVGQGDAAVLELPGGAVWLVDAGGLPFVIPREHARASRNRRGAHGDREDGEREHAAALPGRRAVLPFLAERRIERLELVVLSHPHPDHYEGLRALARAVAIDAVWVARPDAEQPHAGGYGGLLDELRARGTRIEYPILDRPYEHRGVELTALAPYYLDARAAVDGVMGVNDNSLVVRVGFAGRALLFAGDLEWEGEREIVNRRGSALRADIVKVPHHGSDTSSTQSFIDATAPSWAIISCGAANRFGFPAASVVYRWWRSGARVLRTDRAGAITVNIDSDGVMRVETFDPVTVLLPPGERP